MKTAAAALILYLGLGCAAGLPVEKLEKLEKLMSRARRLSTNDDGDDYSFAACSNELDALYACPTAAGTTLGDDDYWTADDDDDDGDDDEPRVAPPSAHAIPPAAADMPRSGRPVDASVRQR